MLMNREWSEWRESCVLLQETPSAAAVFPLFLKWVYFMLFFFITFKEMCDKFVPIGVS